MTPCVSVRLQHKFSDHSDAYQYLSGTSHQFICYSIPFIQYSVYFRYSPKTNMVWTLFHIDLALPNTHSRSWTNIIFSILLVQKEGRGYFLWISQKCCAIERNSSHESWPDTKKFRAAKHSTACCAFSCFLIWVAINNIFQHRLQASAFCSSVLVKTGGTPQTGGTWIVAAIPVKVELDRHQVHHL